jgi:hypothetical protein
MEHVANRLLLHPHRPGEIRRRNDAVALGQLGKRLGRALERERVGPLGVDHGEHLAADAEGEVAAPFDVLGHSGQ